MLAIRFFVIIGLILLSFSPDLYSQAAGEAVKIIELDSVTKNSKEIIPLDIPFVFKLQNKRVYKQAYLYFERNFSLKKKYSHETLSIEQSDQNHFFSSKPLLPRSDYKLILLRQPYAEEWKRLFQVNESIYQFDRTHDPKYYNDATVNYHLIGNTAPIAFVTPTSFDKYLGFYRSELATLYDANFAEYTDIAHHPPRLQRIGSDQRLKLLLCISIAAKKDDLSFIIQRLCDIEYGAAQAVEIGVQPLNNQYFTTQTSHNDFIARIKNLNDSFIALRKIYDFIELNDKSGNLQNSSDLLNQMSIVINALVNRKNKLNDAVQKIANSPAVFFTDDYFSSGQDKFTSSLGQVIQPNVGIALIYTNRDKKFGNYIRPYFGLDVNFRPVNKNVRFYRIDGWGKYFGVMAGFTIGTLQKQDEPIRDLFSTNNMVAGLNLRASHAIRFNVGTILFNVADPNPLIERTQRKYGFFYGISFDFEIRTALAGLAGLLKL